MSIAMSKAFVSGLAAALALAPLAVQAQTYPDKVIKTIVTVGGTAEGAVRLLSQKMSVAFGQPIIVEGQPGAGGSVGAGMLARSAPDGYTIGMGTTSAMVLRQFIAKNTPYDTLKDFTPISQIAEAVSSLTSGPSIPVKTLQELLEYAKKNPGKITYGTSGIGTTHHLSGEVLSQLTGIKWRHVPYKSGSLAMQDLLAGRIDIVFGVLGAARSGIDNNTIQLLAINGGKRYPAYANAPTVNEVLPKYVRPDGWMAYFGPAGLPAPIARRLHAEISKGMRDAEIAKSFDNLGFMVEVSESPEKFAAEIRQTVANTAQMMKAAGIVAK